MLRRRARPHQEPSRRLGRGGAGTKLYVIRPGEAGVGDRRCALDHRHRLLGRSSTTPSRSSCSPCSASSASRPPSSPAPISLALLDLRRGPASDRPLPRRAQPALLMTAGSIAGTVLVLAWSRVEGLAAFYAIWIGDRPGDVDRLYEPAFAVLAKWFPAAEPRAARVTTLTLVAALGELHLPPALTGADRRPRLARRARRARADPRRHHDPLHALGAARGARSASPSGDRGEPSTSASRRIALAGRSGCSLSRSASPPSPASR